MRSRAIIVSMAKNRAVAVDRVFNALADPTRRSVVELLGSRPRRAGELAAATRTSPPTMSRHLRVLLAWDTQAHDGQRRLCQLQIRNLFRDGGCCLIRQLRDVPCKLDIPGPKHQCANVPVCRGLHRPQRRALRGVRSGQVQSREWV